MGEVSEDHEDTSIGGITWHSSEEDGGPDVGVSVYLGEGRRLWCGEVSRSLFEECDGAEWFPNDMGCFLVYYDPAPRLLAKVGDYDQAREFIDVLAMVARDADAPTLARTLGLLKS